MEYGKLQDIAIVGGYAVHLVYPKKSLTKE